jgi:hypothetical protein
METTRNLCKILVEKLEERSTVDEDEGKTVCVGMKIHLAHPGDRCQALANTTMYLEILEMSRISLPDD